MSRAPLSRTDKSCVVSVRLITSTIDRMRELARETDNSLGGMLRHAIRTYAERQIPDTEVGQTETNDAYRSVRSVRARQDDGPANLATQ
jgi:hypothetical protein